MVKTKGEQKAGRIFFRNFPAELRKHLKMKAVETGRTMEEIAVEAIEKHLGKGASNGARL